MSMRSDQHEAHGEREGLTLLCEESGGFGEFSQKNEFEKKMNSKKKTMKLNSKNN